ncbi:MAG TPA: zinc ribbon domain-containing protein [Aquella sp.]|nr:zinc ribbon domain-containing protein [Aquella sp.]
MPHPIPTKKAELPLSVREYVCYNKACNLTINRDYNAALNIRTAGMAGIAW